VPGYVVGSSPDRLELPTQEEWAQISVGLERIQSGGCSDDMDGLLATLAGWHPQVQKTAAPTLPLLCTRNDAALLQLCCILRVSFWAKIVLICAFEGQT
jgi:hypothetical protein